MNNTDKLVDVLIHLKSPSPILKSTFYKIKQKPKVTKPKLCKCKDSMFGYLNDKCFCFKCEKYI